MSLSSLLLSGSINSIDKDLDALFTAKPLTGRGPTTAAAAQSTSKEIPKKRKAVVQDDKARGEHPKRSKSGPMTSGHLPGQPLVPGMTSAKPKPRENKKSDGRTKVPDRKGKAKEVGESDEDENSDLEKAYLDANAEEDQPDSEDGEDAEAPPVHESLKQGSKKPSRPKAKYVPSDETPERRDQRTIFIGNLSVNVAQKRPLLKQLQRHILSQVPSAKIESTRFRSVPFQAPTSKLEDDAADSSKSKPTKPTPTPSASSTKQGRPHDLDRTSAWRQNQDEDAAVKNDEKKYLTPSQKKKIAFINQEFHSTADAVNAYIVFAHPVPAEDRPGNLPPPAPAMNPYEAARIAAAKCDGSLFMDRAIRVDLVGKSKRESDREREAEAGLVETDPKLSVFVGNLDFASKEEDLRVFFDGVISAERGPPESQPNDGGDDVVKKPETWVTRVRVVRDKETQLGKGFAYVQFTDRECVDEILAIEEGKLKFAKRKLRVQRCKTLPGSSVSTRGATTTTTTTTTTLKSTKHPRVSGKPAGPLPGPITVPKGDPALGEKLAHLTKEARKQVKSADADRVARRLAKKKARMALGSEGGVRVLGKERERERVRKSGKMGAGAGAGAGGGVKKKRVRSEKSMAKRNTKKDG